MKKITNASSLPLFLLVVFTSMLLLSSCSSNKPYFSFSPAPPAYVKKQTSPAVVKPTPAATEDAQTVNTHLMASASVMPEQAMVLPEVAALEKKETQLINTQIAKTFKAGIAAPEVKKDQKLTLAQKLVLHKIQKQAKKLSNQDQQTKNAAGPVSNRSAIGLVLIGLVVAVFGTFLGSAFYTLGVLILLVGLVLLILNYI